MKDYVPKYHSRSRNGRLIYKSDEYSTLAVTVEVLLISQSWPPSAFGYEALRA
jgi:hypothetical protein